MHWLNRIKDADVIIFVGGISPQLEGEEMPVNHPGFNGGDRTSILLPAVQTEFMKALKVNRQTGCICNDDRKCYCYSMGK